MRKLSIFVLGALSVCSFAFAPMQEERITAKAEQALVYVGGMSAGFTLQSGCVQVVGFCEVMTDEGVSSPALRAGLRTGDKILSAANIDVATIERLNEILDTQRTKAVALRVKRGEEVKTYEITPVKDKISGKYKIGILARDNVSGIGTVTYIDTVNGRFGSLGHSVVGEDHTNMKIAQGTVYECSIVGVCKGVRGKAGELKGMFLSNKTLGKAEKLCDCGIFGQISEDFEVSDLMRAVADSTDVAPGKAYIYSTVNGVEPKRYDIEIVKVDKGNRDNKNYVLKIVDDDLIAETGGIVQGMSGSPIMQNGKLIGAITHVFVNDPTRGYGIDIQEMLQQ